MIPDPEVQVLDYEGPSHLRASHSHGNTPYRLPGMCLIAQLGCNTGLRLKSLLFILTHPSPCLLLLMSHSSSLSPHWGLFERGEKQGGNISPCKQWSSSTHHLFCLMWWVSTFFRLVRSQQCSYPNPSFCDNTVNMLVKEGQFAADSDYVVLF